MNLPAARDGLPAVGGMMVATIKNLPIRVCLASAIKTVIATVSASTKKGNPSSNINFRQAVPDRLGPGSSPGSRALKNSEPDSEPYLGPGRAWARA